MLDDCAADRPGPDDISLDRDAVFRGQRLGLREGRFGSALLLAELGIERQLERHQNDVQDTYRAALLLGQLEGRGENLVADRAELERDQDALVEPFHLRHEIGLRRLDALEHGLAPGAAHGRKHRESQHDPDRASDANCVVGQKRGNPDQKGERRPDQRRERHRRPPHGNVDQRPKRTLELRFGEAQPDHGKLRCGEGNEDSEAVEAREEPDGPADEDSRKQERRREEDGGRDRRRSDQRPLAQAAERVREQSVLPKGVREPSDTGDRGGDRCKEDDAAAQAKEDPQDVHCEARELPSECCRDAHDRRPDPRCSEVGGKPARAGGVGMGRKRRDAHDPDCDRHEHCEPDAGEKAPREGAAGLPRFRREVCHSLEPRVREHCQRKRERDRAPRRRAAEVDAARKGIDETRNAKPSPTMRKWVTNASPATTTASR